jgi:hypothetical protein
MVLEIAAAINYEETQRSKEKTQTPGTKKRPAYMPGG